MHTVELLGHCLIMINYRTRYLRNFCLLIDELSASNATTMVNILSYIFLSSNLPIINIEISHNNIFLIGFKEFNNIYKFIFKMFKHEVRISIHCTYYQRFVII